VPACIPYQFVPLDIKEYIVIPEGLGAAPPFHFIVPAQDRVPDPESIIVKDLPAVGAGIVIVMVPETSKMVPSVVKLGVNEAVLVVSVSVISKVEISPVRFPVTSPVTSPVTFPVTAPVNPPVKVVAVRFPAAVKDAFSVPSI
jgi:hypothetical protein